jgi:glycerol-3-phosphate O-acyltransferase / dihydroxyacetone phosphate acyltransferase
MLYRLTKPLAKIAFTVYFRKMYLSHLEEVPEGKPVILASNHPTAFIEPCIATCWLSQPLSYLARGDIYLNSGLVRTLYKVYHLIPVFRIDDGGYGHIKGNYKSFDKCFDALSEKKAMMILAEGRVKHEKRLRPIVKGAARMVFGTLEKYGDLDIHIVPVGANYTNSDAFRSVVMLDFGPPIRATEYTAMYHVNPPKAINALTDELEKRLKQRVIHIASPEDDEFAERLFELARNENEAPSLPVVSSSDAPLHREMAIANAVNAMSAAEKEAWKKRTGAYFDLLKKKGVTDWGVKHPHRYRGLPTVLMWLGWLPHFIGRVLNYLPLKWGDSIATRLAPTIEFRAAMTGVSGALLWLVYMVGWTVGLWLCCHSWRMLPAVLLIPALGWYSLFYHDHLKQWQQSRRAKKLPEENAHHLLMLREELEKIIRSR